MLKGFDGFYSAEAEGLEVASQPLLRFPKLASGLERRQVLTAAPTNTRFIVRRTRSYVLPRTLRVPSGYFVFIKTKTAPVGTVFFWQGQKDLKLLRNPSCGFQNLLPAWSAGKF